jgi:hypothetical protein
MVVEIAGKLRIDVRVDALVLPGVAPEDIDCDDALLYDIVPLRVDSETILLTYASATDSNWIATFPIARMLFRTNSIFVCCA